MWWKSEGGVTSGLFNEPQPALVRRRTRKRGQDREQQQLAHAVALALDTARVGHFGEGGKLGGERHRATSQSEKVASIQPSRHPAAAHAQAAPAQLNG